MISIGITTFEHRFEKYFKHLVNEIKSQEPDIEIIVAVNGEHNKPFNQTYRKEMLEFCSEHDNVFPIFYPQFRGLSKLWNNIIIHSSNDNILLLNDDVTITSNRFVESIIRGVKIYKDISFKLNGSWSHVLLNKKEVIETGFFDERLLGISEEDGDFEWRYIGKMNRPFLNVSLGGIINHVDMSHAPTNIQAGSSGKYSKFNRETLFNVIYHEDQNMGQRRGMISEKLIENHREKQYPYEVFYQENKNKI